LIKHSFAVARKMGYDVNINFGNPGNYVSRGFVSCKKKNVSFVREGNFPTALLVAELVPGRLTAESGCTFLPPPPIVARTSPLSKHLMRHSLPKKRSGCRVKRNSISIAILR